jgi:hypothetical protein
MSACTVVSKSAAMTHLHWFSINEYNRYGGWSKDPCVYIESGSIAMTVHIIFGTLVNFFAARETLKKKMRRMVVSG